MGERLPNATRAIIEERKITGYLLSRDHPDGRGKTLFFESFGFDISRWEELRDALLVHGGEGELRRVEENPYGTKYVLEGPLRSPDGRDPVIRTVWLVEKGRSHPRLVTAYPGGPRGGESG